MYKANRLDLHPYRNVTRHNGVPYIEPYPSTQRLPRTYRIRGTHGTQPKELARSTAFRLPPHREQERFTMDVKQPSSKRALCTSVVPIVGYLTRPMNNAKGKPANDWD